MNSRRLKCPSPKLKSGHRTDFRLVFWKGPMSALGQKRTCAVQLGMSALPPKADVRRTRLLDHGLRLFVSKWARRATRGYNCDISMGTAAPMIHHLTGFRGSDGQSQAQIHD